ncbi:hypothetical protein OG21DRAFT_787733 [Imleria badia]|nr:hypothetical protein OG21DRAFT_787733 [Imleria badia]
MRDWQSLRSSHDHTCGSVLGLEQPHLGGYCRLLVLIAQLHQGHISLTMRQQDTRAAGHIAFAVVVWIACLPVVSACDSLTTSCDNTVFSQQNVVAIVVTVVVFSLAIAGVWLRRRRRLRTRTTQLRQIPYNGMRNQSLNRPKPPSAPAPIGYPVYYQATPPAPPHAHIPRYPPRGYDTSHRNSQSQWPSSSNLRPISESVGPVSPVSTRAPSSVTSRPISSFDTATPSLRSSVRRDEPIASVPRSLAAQSSASLRSAQRNVVEPPRSPPPPSPQTRSPSVVIPPPASGAIPPSNPTRPFALSPMHTGATNSNIDEAPPPYTPI